jgi:hypothetical protein
MRGSPRPPHGHFHSTDSIDRASIVQLFIRERRKIVLSGRNSTIRIVVRSRKIIPKKTKMRKKSTGENWFLIESLTTKAADPMIMIRAIKEKSFERTYFDCMQKQDRWMLAQCKAPVLTVHFEAPLRTTFLAQSACEKLGAFDELSLMLRFSQSSAYGAVTFSRCEELFFELRRAKVLLIMTER